MKNEHPFHETLTHRWSGHGAGAVISAPIEPNGPECPARFEACCSLRAVACLGSILLTTVLALPAPVEAAPVTDAPAAATAQDPAPQAAAA